MNCIGNIDLCLCQGCSCSCLCQSDIKKFYCYACVQPDYNEMKDILLFSVNHVHKLLHHILSLTLLHIQCNCLQRWFIPILLWIRIALFTGVYHQEKNTSWNSEWSPDTWDNMVSPMIETCMMINVSWWWSRSYWPWYCCCVIVYTFYKGCYKHVTRSVVQVACPHSSVTMSMNHSVVWYISQDSLDDSSMCRICFAA